MEAHRAAAHRRGPDTVYDPGVDAVVQEELAAEAAAAAARVVARADELQALRELGTLEQSEPREDDEAVRDELTRRAGSYVQKDVDTWPRTAGTTRIPPPP